MKISSNELRAMILEELKAVRGETLTENEEVDEGVGDYGSPEGRERADANFDAAVATLKAAIQGGSKSLEDIMTALRGGETGPYHARPSRGRTGIMDAEELDAMSGVPDAPAGQEDLEETGCVSSAEEVEELDEAGCVSDDEEVDELDEDEGADEGEEVVEGLSLADEMEGHIDSALEEEGLQTVQESFSERRLARLAGILED